MNGMRASDKTQKMNKDKSKAKKLNLTQKEVQPEFVEVEATGLAVDLVSILGKRALLRVSLLDGNKRTYLLGSGSLKIGQTVTITEVNIKAKVLIEKPKSDGQ